ncbi:MAG TPA: aldo/keto reductase [Croceibacterium sp.]|nr:aldo/keto reductase [Croceibacterium sp.]
MTVRSALDGPLAPLDGRTVVVGAGAVGLTLAIALARSGCPVTVLEGGPREPRADFAQANAGPLPARHYPGLTQGRVKALGGTTRVWGGQLAAFEPGDFERRDTHGEPLWPILYDEVARWLERAFDLLGVSPEARDARAIWQRATGRHPEFGDGLAFGMNVWLRQADFARLFRAELDTLPGLEVITDCPVTALRFAPGSARVACDISLSGGSSRRIVPARLILANGTIEIGGLLLRAAVSEPHCPFAGNQHLGRWYFDHLHGLVGEVERGDARALPAMFDNVYFEGRKYGVNIRAVGQASAAFTLNPAITAGQLLADARSLGGRILQGGGVGATAARALSLARILLPVAWRYWRHRRSSSLFDRGTQLGVAFEQLPSPECFLVLDPEVPPAHAPVGVHWSIDPALIDDLAEATERFARAFAAHGLGRIALDPRLARRDPSLLDDFHDASHQMGGARMARSAEHGVVDSDLRVFGTDNLFVAGAAVFPSGSFANPTLTAIALGQRLAAHLADAGEIEGGGSRLRDRLVFGCSRLAGGASARSSARLLGAALDSGVRAIDCAPSYGLGLAETVVGQVLRRRGAAGVTVIAKLGSRRDPRGWIKSWLREAKRRLRPAGPRSLAGFAPQAPVARYGRADFTPQALRESFAVARRRLGRIDLLLLHDCGPEELTPEVAAVAAGLARSAGARLGYANSAVFDPETEREFPPGSVAECAIDPRWLTGETAPPGRDDLILHSIVPTGEWLARTDPAFAAGLDAAAALIPAGDPATARIAALFALAAERVRGSRLVFASTDRRRLGALLGAFAAIDEAALGPRIAAAFGQRRAGSGEQG